MRKGEGYNEHGQWEGYPGSLQPMMSLEHAVEVGPQIHDVASMAMSREERAAAHTLRHYKLGHSVRICVGSPEERTVFRLGRRS